MDLSKKTKDELKKIALDLGLGLISTLKKDELISAILNAQTAERTGADEREKPSAERTSADECAKPSTERTGADERAKPSTERTGADEKPSTERTSADEHAKPSAERTSADEHAKPSAERTSADERTKPTAERTGADECAKPSTERTGAGAGAKPSTERTGADECAKPSAERTGADERAKPSAERTGADEHAKPSAERTSADECAKPSTERTGAGAGEKPSTERTGADEHAKPSTEPTPTPKNAPQPSVQSDTSALKNATQTAEPTTSPKNAKEVSGVLEILADGFGFLRVSDFKPSESDCYVSPTQIRRLRLRMGDFIVGDARMPDNDEDKYPALIYVKSINSLSVDESFRRKNFERLTPIYPAKKFSLATSTAGKIMDIVSPIGKGQRGMIVAPPKAGKTTLIKDIAQAIEKNHPETELIVLLIDERPEEVTDMKRSIKGKVVASTFDSSPENHARISELVLEYAQRQVEIKKDVVILLDSITRLARAYNLTVAPTGKTLSGGLDPDALIKPKKFFGAARNIEEGGSLTILATALVETGSRMDDVIFEEFKGTGNMELKLDRSLQERRIFPAIDITKSGTRKEELLLNARTINAMYRFRSLSSQKPQNEVMAFFLGALRSAKSSEMFLDIIEKGFTK